MRTPKEMKQLTAADWLMPENRPDLPEAVVCANEILARMPKLLATLTGADGAPSQALLPENHATRGFVSNKLRDAIGDIAEGHAAVRALAPALASLEGCYSASPVRIAAALSPRNTEKIGMRLETGLRHAATGLTKRDGSPVNSEAGVAVQLIQDVQPFVCALDAFRISALEPVSVTSPTFMKELLKAGPRDASRPARIFRIGK